jgi:ribosome modulation factor
MDPNKRKELVKAAQRGLQKNLNEEKISFSTGLCPYGIWFT